VLKGLLSVVGAARLAEHALEAQREDRYDSAVRQLNSAFDAISSHGADPVVSIRHNCRHR
jgi:hypothetical protein